MRENTSFIRGQKIINKNTNDILSFDYKLSVGVCKVNMFTNDMGDVIKLVSNDLLQYDLFNPTTL